MQKDDMRKYSAEFVGTFVLVFGGVGSAVLAGEKIGFLGISFAFGLSLLAMAYTMGPISGCHINPAVTLGALIAGKLERRLAAGYWVAQILGAIVAAAVLLLVAKGIAGGYDPVAAGFGTNGYDDRSPLHYGLVSAIVVEIVLTAVLVLTVLGTTDVSAPVGFAGLPIGLVLVLIHLVAIPVDGTSVNPARSIGPALFAGGAAIAQLWVFIIMPLIGGALGAAIYLAIHAPEAVISVQEAEAALTSQQAERQDA
jgi:aquaporin Z